MRYKQEYQKPDGRRLRLYARHPIDPTLVAPSPSALPVAMEGAHLRWHPLRQEWVAYAGHRQNRTFLPPKEFNPLAPMTDPNFPTELPQGNYDIAVFENMFPTLNPEARYHPDIPGVQTAAAKGVCEVVVYSQDADRSLGRLPLGHIELLLEVWGDRYRELGARDDIAYVLPFENKGPEQGVTLNHPHGQIYAYPFIPPIPKLFMQSEQAYYQLNRRTLLLDMIDREVQDQRRIIYEGSATLAFTPVCARYPYEVWVVPRRPVPSIDQLNDLERRDLARTLKTLLLKYDGLWKRSFPYLMLLYQAPCDGAEHPESHLHFEFLPPYRTSDRLKYLAGTELGAGVFANDAFPEDKAKELRAVEVSFE